jgi:hypothetical protein
VFFCDKSLTGFSYSMGHKLPNHNICVKEIEGNVKAFSLFFSFENGESGPSRSAYLFVSIFSNLRKKTLFANMK